MKQINENLSYYKQTLEEASKLLDRKFITSEEKLELFEKLYALLSNCFPIEIKKLRLYSVNRINGVIDKKYLLKYEDRGYIDSNIKAISLFTEMKSKSLGIGTNEDYFYLQKIRLLNFRSITEMTLDFKKGINVLIGDNGVGKTSILDAIAISLKEVIGSYNITKKNLGTKDIQLTKDYTSIESIISDSENDYYSFKGISSRRTRMICSKKPLKRTEQTKNISEYLNSHYIYPIISYHCISDGKQETGYKTKKFDSMQGYAGCLNGRADLKLVALWLEKSESNEKQKYFRLINKFISLMISSKTKVTYTNSDEFIVKLEGNDIPLSYMSSGFKTILYLVMDIAYRLTVLNPSIEDPSQMFGVVLIDEIELHLHPNWQWKVLSCLEKMFPNIQFIISTHSPMIISSCINCNLILLSRSEKGDVNYIEQASDGLYGKAIEDVLVYNMGSERIPLELKTAYTNFQYYYNLSNFDLARETLKGMKEQFGEDNGTVKDADFMLNLSFDDENGG